MIISWFVGRQNINELRRFSVYTYRVLQSDGCCTQAMLYPISSVEPLSHHLVSTFPHIHTDLAIMNYARNQDLPYIQVEPNLFHHTGLITTLQADPKHPEEFIFHL